MTVRLFLSKAWAFLKRDFKIASSYQLDFAFTALNSLFILTLLFFVGKMVAPSTAGLDDFGGSYFGFALIGYAFYQYFQQSLFSFSGAIQREQVTGCLESMVATQTRAETSILLSSLYGILWSLLHLALILTVGCLVFGLQLSHANLAVAAAGFVLSIVVFVSFGILSASFIVVLKKGDPISWLITTLNFVFGGAFFPHEQMPPWMQAVSRAVPARYSLDILRASLVGGKGFGELVGPLGVLAAIAAALLPLSLLVFRTSVQKAKRDGSLVLY